MFADKKSVVSADKKSVVSADTTDCLSADTTDYVSAITTDLFSAYTTYFLSVNTTDGPNRQISKNSPLGSRTEISGCRSVPPEPNFGTQLF